MLFRSEAMKQDTFIKEVLGEHTFDIYIENKIQEWDDYRSHVTEWEVEKYLYRY